jgi:hypothetical protein
MNKMDEKTKPLGKLPQIRCPKEKWTFGRRQW